jgi:hypothetical protein
MKSIYHNNKERRFKMAGESLSLSELKDWYSKFNAVISSYSGGNIAALTMPDADNDTTAVAGDINKLY